MKEYLVIGTTPTEEDCIQVRSGQNYLPLMRKECKRFLDLLRSKFGDEPDGAKLCIKDFPHDFGTYLEVVCEYDPDKEEAVEYAFRCENDPPRTWNETSDV
ncbi:MAG: hypothetical protein JNL74_21430 [Fibrobacteres bacterium]|nr:hypothetical protein [Fibrobacterota bacterium]